MAQLVKSSPCVHEDLSSIANVCGWQCAPNHGPGELAEPQGFPSQSVSPTGKLRIYLEASEIR